MLVDTNILIWVERGNTEAARFLEGMEEKYISILTYMELLQGAPSKKQSHIVKTFLSDYNFEVLPLTENIGHRSSIYIEEYAHQGGLRAGDAIIAATAVENNLALATGNQKHFKSIHDLKLHIFRP